MEKIKLLLIDDHAVVRSGLRMLLDTQPDMTILGEAETGLQGLGLARQLSPDVIVMDITLPDIGGIEATRRTEAKCFSTPRWPRRWSRISWRAPRPARRPRPWTV